LGCLAWTFMFCFAGFHSMIPFLTQYEAIQTTIQTDQVKYW
jgi:hypothetical protein